MKKLIRIWSFSTAVIIVSLMLTHSCKKDDNNPQNTVKDIDGNIYNTVTIGTQVWMVENLKVTHYQNGDEIPNIADGIEWINLSSGAYCFHSNSSNNDEIYGKLYNWYAVNDTRKIAPKGWHVATDDEWTILLDHLGGEDIAGGKLKETGTNHWITPNTGATNESGFTALPGSVRSYTAEGAFSELGVNCDFWSATEYNVTNAWLRYLRYNNKNVGRSYSDKKTGASVRCVKD